MQNFRGDTFFRSYSVEFENEKYNFKIGDSIKLAFCLYTGEKFLEKIINVSTQQEQIDVSWSANEMATLKIGEYILETEITTSSFTKTHQEKITITEDFIYGESNDED